MVPVYTNETICYQYEGCSHVEQAKRETHIWLSGMKVKDLLRGHILDFVKDLLVSAV